MRRLRLSGPPRDSALPQRHGDQGDPRYPSPTTLRQTAGFIVDLVIHLGLGYAVVKAMSASPYALLFGLCAFVVLSIAHRVLLQWLSGTTLGKGLTGLCLIRDDTGGPPTLWSLIKAWLLGVLVTIAAIIDSN